MKKILLIICLFIGINGFCQDFLSDFPQLTTDNLPNFFSKWQEYSAKQSQKVVRDTLLCDIANEVMDDELGRDRCKYRVIPQTISVEKYDCDADSAYYIRWFLERQRELEPITTEIQLPLPEDGLFLTDSIYVKLADFCGGLNYNEDNLSDFNNDNIELLEQFIPVTYGHWGGYWHFYSFPQIELIRQYNNIISVSERTTWCNGDEVWFIKEGDKFKPTPPRNEWIE